MKSRTNSAGTTLSVGDRVRVCYPDTNYRHHGAVGTIKNFPTGQNRGFAALDLDELTPTLSQTVEELRRIGITHDTAQVHIDYLERE